jgi:hypothetical protein
MFAASSFGVKLLIPKEVIKREKMHRLLPYIDILNWLEVDSVATKGLHMIGKAIEIGGVRIKPSDLEKVPSFRVGSLRFEYSFEHRVWKTEYDGINYIVIVTTDGNQIAATKFKL